MAKVKLTATRKRILVGALLGVLVVLVGASIWVQPSFFGEDSKPTKLSVDDAQVKATEHAYDGDTDGAIQVYSEQIDISDSDEERRDLLEAKALFSYHKGRLDEALEAAQQADRLESRMSTWILLAEIHEVRGENGQAADYYQKAVDASDENNFERNSWQERAEELRS